MKRRYGARSTSLAALVMTLLVAACSGGGGTSPGTTLPIVTPTNAPTAAPQSTQLKVSVSGGQATAAHLRNPQTLSNGAAYFVLYWDHDTTDALVFTTAGSVPSGETAVTSFTPGSAGNTGAASVTFTATVPAGIHDFTLITYQADPGCSTCGAHNDPVLQPNGGQHPINSGTNGGVAVAVNGTTAIGFTLNATIDHILFSGASLLSNNCSACTVLLTEGTSVGATNLTVAPYDSSNNAILVATSPNGTFTNPITFSTNDLGSNFGSTTNATYSTVPIAGTTAAIGFAVQQNGGGNVALGGAAGPVTFTSVLPNTLLVYQYAANQSGDTNVDGKGIVGARVTAQASGATPAQVVFVSQPALETTSHHVTPVLEAPQSPYGSANACAQYTPSTGVSTQVYGYTNNQNYRIQVAASGAPVTTLGSGGNDNLNQIVTGAATNVSTQSALTNSGTSNPIFLSSTNGAGAGVHKVALTVSYKNQVSTSVLWALTGNKSFSDAICPSLIYASQSSSGLNSYNLPLTASSAILASKAMPVAQGIAFAQNGTSFYVNQGTASDDIATFTLPFTGTSAPTTTALTATSNPNGVAVDLFGNVAVAEPGLAKVEIYNSSLALAATLQGVGSNIVLPIGVAYDNSTDKLYVADRTTGIVTFQCPCTNGSAGTVLIGSGSNGVTTPFSVAFDSSANLYVANNSVPSIEVFAPPYTGAAAATTSNGVSGPTNLIIDQSTNTLYVADNSANVLRYALPLTNAEAPSQTFGLANVWGVAVH